MYTNPKLRRGVRDLLQGKGPHVPPDTELLQAINASDRSMRSLKLNFRKLNDQDAVALANAFKTNTSLTSIDLSNNLIGDEGVEAIATALRDHDTAMVLILNENKISGDGAQALANLLRHNTALALVILDEEKINPEILESISQETAINEKGRAVYKKQMQKFTINLLLTFRNSPIFYQLPTELVPLILENIHPTLTPESQKKFLALRGNRTREELSSTNQYVGDKFALKLGMSWIFSNSIDILDLISDAEKYQQKNPTSLSIKALLSALEEIKSGTNITNLEQYLNSIEDKFTDEFKDNIALKSLLKQTRHLKIETTPGTKCTEMSFEIGGTSSVGNYTLSLERRQEKRNSCSIC